ncbi:hypothetical protein JOB18_047126 [Solea senegalensis]|uniref:Uncharacterized protein n=1 Tax=Solea senegalensis TaxID=28829 RepID=A0AAV6R9T7_SOLSE|nr:hypothetical protein JOB18_047126 [Solea senegalensis]
MDIHTPTYRHGKSSSSHLQSLDSSGSVKQRLGSSVASLSSWQQQSGSGGSKCLMHAGGDYMPELLDSIQHTALDERQGGKTQEKINRLDYSETRCTFCVCCCF